jgi:hypothetical protein
MGEPDPWEDADHEHYRRPRTIGSRGPWTDGGVGWALWDQLLVTKRMLKGGLVRLKEATVRIGPPLDGCSDHGVVAAELDC